MEKLKILTIRNFDSRLWEGTKIRMVADDQTNDIWFICKDVLQFISAPLDTDHLLDIPNYAKAIGVTTIDGKSVRIGLMNQAGILSMLYRVGALSRCMMVVRNLYRSNHKSIRYMGFTVYTPPEKPKEDVEIEEKVKFYDAVNDASGKSIHFRDFSRLVSRDILPIGQNRMFYCLTYYGFLIRHSGGARCYYLPTQRYSEMGIFDVVDSLVKDNNLPKPFISTIVKITPKGQIYLIKWFREHRDQIIKDEVLWNIRLKQSRPIKVVE